MICVCCTAAKYLHIFLCVLTDWGWKIHRISSRWYHCYSVYTFWPAKRILPWCTEFQAFSSAIQWQFWWSVKVLGVDSMVTCGVWARSMKMCVYSKWLMPPPQPFFFYSHYIPFLSLPTTLHYLLEGSRYSPRHLKLFIISHFWTHWSII